MARKEGPLSVSELTRYVKGLVDGDAVLRRIWVRGEISNFKRHYSGHLYFSLKDAHSSLRCVMFRSHAERLQFEPESGMSVLAGGSVSVYERDGVYQLYTEELQPDGLGALNLAYLQLKARLEEEGLFDPARKRPLPRLPRKVGVATALTGAAIRDIINISRRRFPNVHLVIAPVLVQGAEAPPQIARALDALARVDGVDVIICGRGGGSLEDLWAFNDERVARAIHRCPVPVISAVGHETDFTIADFVADLRAPTPSAAAELAVPDRREEQLRLAAAQARLLASLRRGHEVRASRLKSLLRSPALERPLDGVRQRRQRVDDLSRAMGAAMTHRLQLQRARRDQAAAQLQALSPLAVLGRGYSLTRLAGTSRVVRDARDAPAGTLVDVTLQEGELRCRVLESGVRGNGAAEERVRPQQMSLAEMGLACSKEEENHGPQEG
ncbi:MAG: exodeoxyribonuclease VII large subunit [Bacillota bacterium]